VWLDRAGVMGAGEAPVEPTPPTLRVRNGTEVPDAVACLFARPLRENAAAACC